MDVVIIGGGFAGLSCFQHIDRKKREVRLLTNRNHFLFTPLLPLAATGGVEVRSIVEPITSFEKSPGEIIIAEAVSADFEKKILHVRYDDGTFGEISYETLVIASGAVTADYGIPGIHEYCYFMKEMKDARKLREKILFQFEKAAHLQGAALDKALNFVIVGGGPTGVETACEIHDLAQEDLKKIAPALIPHVKIQIIEAGPDILTVFDKILVKYAEGKLKQKGILVKKNLAVKGMEKDKAILSNGESEESETILWTAGNAAGGFTKKVADTLKIKLGPQGRFPIGLNLKIEGIPYDLYAIGDCAVMRDKQGQPVPQTAQVAMKQGIFLGREISNRRNGEFSFKSMGMLASLGSGSAIADLGTFQFKGLLAWWFWKAAYITRLVSLRNKLSVLFDWIKVRFFGRNTARIEF